MPNPGGKVENLMPHWQQPKWNHETKAVRVPKPFCDEILRYARKLDDGRVTLQSQGKSLIELLEEANLDLLFKVKNQLPILIRKAKSASLDRRIEEGLIKIFPSDGIITKSHEEVRLNKLITDYGAWLSRLASQDVALPRRHAKNALSILEKCSGKLSLNLPKWEKVEGAYPVGVYFEKPTGRNRLILLEDKETVALSCDLHDAHLAKQVLGYKFIVNPFRGWSYPIESAYRLIEIFKPLGYEIDMELEGLALEKRFFQGLELEKKYQAEERKALQRSKVLNSLISKAKLDSPLPNGWFLFDHQKKGIEWLLAHRLGGIHRGGILADEMGLGKTVQLLVAAKAMKDVYGCSVLVVCPASLKANWLREACMIGVEVEVYSWSKMPKLPKNKYVLIADEAHFAQGGEATARGKNLLKLANFGNALAVWLATGTPMRNGRPIELFPLLQAIEHPLGKNLDNYELRYCDAQNRTVRKGLTIWDTSGAINLRELSKLTSDVILQRKKKDCLDLPEKIRTIKAVPLTATQKRQINKEIAELVEDFLARANQGEVDAGAEALVTLGYVRKVNSKYKLDAAIKLAQELLGENQPVVLFTEFKNTAQKLHDELGGELLTGSTPQAQRQPMCDRFQTGKSKVFISTSKAGGVGITLTASSNVVLVDRPWTPGDAEQAEDRCHRIGTTSTVNAYWLQLGEIDKAIDDLLSKKGKHIEVVLNGKKRTVGSIEEIAIEYCSH